MREDDYESMDIRAPSGTKVIYMGQGGWDHDKETANKHLVVGETYTIDYTEVHSWHTRVYLEEIEGEYFNSVMFKHA